MSKQIEVQEICRYCFAQMNDVVAGTHVSWGECDDCLHPINIGPGRIKQWWNRLWRKP